jgi:phosphopantetheinyl transferase
MKSTTVQLWTIDLKAFETEAVLTDNRAWPTRQARRRALRHVADQAGVELFWSCPVCGQDGHGRPHVRGRGHDISVTWAGRWGLVAFAAGPVGVDAELLRDAPRPVTSTLSSAEAAALASRPGPHRAESFLRLWTAKEAVAKADGRGLTLPLAQIDVAAVITHGRAAVALDGVTWHVSVIGWAFPDGEPATVAVAANREIRRVVWSPMAAPARPLPQGAS